LTELASSEREYFLLKPKQICLAEHWQTQKLSSTHGAPRGRAAGPRLSELRLEIALSNFDAQTRALIKR
jgi:hypothetical protein